MDLVKVEANEMFITWFYWSTKDFGRVPKLVVYQRLKNWIFTKIVEVEATGNQEYKEHSTM